MFQVALVQKVTAMEMHQDNVFQLVTRNVLDIVVLEVAQELIKCRVCGEKCCVMLMKVIETMVKVGLFDCLAKGAEFSAASNFGYRCIGVWKRRSKSHES